MAQLPDRPAGSLRGAARRDATRHAIEIPLEVSIEREMLIFATTNLSHSGAFLRQAIPYAVGTHATVRILLPDDGPAIVCAAEVANIPDSKEVGMGLKFLDITEKDQRRIDAFGLTLGAKKA